MKAIINKVLVITILGVGLVACSKEEVKPFSPGGSSNINNLSTRGLTGDITTVESEIEQQQGTTSDEETGVTSDNGDNGDGTNITDGGTSSDYDSKGNKRKPGKN